MTDKECTLPEVDCVAAGEQENCRLSMDLLLDAETSFGLGSEVLWEACNELDIPASKLYAAIWNGYAEWMK